MLLQLQTSMPLCYSLFSTWSVFFWYTFVFVIAARKCHNLWTCICIWVFTIRCWYSLSGWSTEAFFFSLFQVLNFKGSLCFSNRLTPGNTWAQDTKPKACCHLLELAVTVITSNISVKLSHLTTHSCISRWFDHIICIAGVYYRASKLDSSLEVPKKGEPIQHRVRPVLRSLILGLITLWKGGVLF